MSPLHLLAGERVLHNTRPSGIWFAPAVLRTLVEAIVGGSLIALAVALTELTLWGTVSYGGLSLIILPPLTFTLLLLRRIQIYRRTTFTITTDRLISLTYERVLRPSRREELHLSPYHPDITSPSLVRILLQTIPWDQYRESTYEGGILGTLFGIGRLRIRYGSSDAPRYLELTLLPYAQDLKHYLDKIRRFLNDQTSKNDLPIFITKPKGKRKEGVGD